MNAQIWLWMLLGCIVTLIVPRLFLYLSRLSDPFPEEIHVLARPLDWQNVKATLDLIDAQQEILGCDPKVARRMLRYRFATSQEYLRRMEHNVWLIELCSQVDRRDAARTQLAMAEDRRIGLSDANGMLEGADLLESDAGLPENLSESAELRIRASNLRLKAEEIFSLSRASEADQTRAVRMLEALQAARRFRSAVKLQLLKLDVLSAILHLDRLNLVSVKTALELWHNGNDAVLLLYQEAASKASLYLSAYYEDEELLIQAWGNAG
jgi:hypothetical protein